MRTLYLQAHCLDESDLKRIEVFLRFVECSDERQWRLSTGGRADLILVGPLGTPGEQTIPLPVDVTRMPSFVRVVDRDEPAGTDPQQPTLRSPIEFDALNAVLKSCEEPEATAAPAATTDADQPPPAAQAEPPASALPAPSAAPDPVGIDADPPCTYRLLRWPAADVLRSEPKLVRVLGLLKHQALSIDRLAVLSGLDGPSCSELMALLNARRLLSRHDAHPMSIPPTSTAEVSERTASTAAPARDIADAGSAQRSAEAIGLFSRLRRRLGLAQKV